MPNVQNTFNAEDFLKTLTNHPGIYQMLDSDQKVLYVGKARNLKKRLVSYYRASGLDSKTIALTNRISDIQATVTGSETEALLLEQSLIKEIKPPYNILFRDDKSYPYIHIESEDEFPALRFYRGARPKHGRLFGPYPNTTAVHNSLNILRKLFLIRGCEDSFFRNRSRPCLQYQIKRCSAPCVGLIKADQYATDLRHALMFLEGKNHKILSEFKAAMMLASNQLDFESAARYRDQIRYLNQVQEEQNVVGISGDVDIVAAISGQGSACIAVLFIRKGRMLGQKTWFPDDQLGSSAAILLSAFLPQFYLERAPLRDLPKEIVLNAKVPDIDVFIEAVTKARGHKMRISDQVRGRRARWRELAVTNAEQALISRLGSRQDMQAKFYALQNSLGLSALPRRLECFDISHTGGTCTVASCVVFDRQGAVKSEYRRFNIVGIKAGDDYAAMSQVLQRRYTRLKADGGALPDIIFVDGGKGQVNQARAVLEKLQLSDIHLIGVAKGPGRKAGLEKLIYGQNLQEMQLAEDAPSLHLIQQIRDEAHRFAITGHRNRRSKGMQRSKLESIPGIGARRRQELLKHFGGLNGVRDASIPELAKTPGISRKLAVVLYNSLRGN